MRNTDTHNSAVLYDIHFAVAGDVVYGDVHQIFGETNTTSKYLEWFEALKTIKSLGPHMVVAGHKRTGMVDGLFNIGTTSNAFLSGITLSREPQVLKNCMKECRNCSQEG